MADREAKLEKMVQEHQALASQIDNLKQERENLNRETQDLNSQLELSRARLDAVSQEAVSKEKKLLTLNKSYEDLKMRLNKQIEEKEMKISTLEDKLNIRLLNKILFAPGQTVISPNGKRVLNGLAAELKKVEGIQISVEGHTDNQPLGRNIRDIYIDNLGLSVARSAAVARTLRKMGVNPHILSAAGFSMHRPAAANASPEGQQQNRRVEIILAPLH
jgi:flagellar motor protein MotB